MMRAHESVIEKDAKNLDFMFQTEGCHTHRNKSLNSLELQNDLWNSYHTHSNTLHLHLRIHHRVRNLHRTTSFVCPFEVLLTESIREEIGVRILENDNSGKSSGEGEEVIVNVGKE